MIYQEEEDRCGEASIRNVINTFYRKEKAGYRRLKNQCLNFLDMKVSLEEYGIEGKGYEFKNIDDIVKVPGEKILLLKVEGNQKGHFVRLKRKLFGLYYIEDPAVGVKRLSKDDINKITTNNVLICNLNEKKPIKSPKIIRNVDKALLLISSFVMSILAFLILEGKWLNIPGWGIILSVLGLIISIFLSKSLSTDIFLWSMERYGGEYVSRNNNPEDLSNVSNLITNEISFFSNIFSSCFALLFLLLFFLSSDAAFFYSSLVAFIADWGIHISFQGYLSKRRSEIYSLEKDISIRKDKSKEAAIKASMKASDYGKIVAMEDLFSSFCTILICTIIFYEMGSEVLSSVFSSALVLIVAKEVDKPIKKTMEEKDHYSILLKVKPDIFNLEGLFLSSLPKRDKEES